MSDSVTPWTAARQASLSFTISCSLLRFVSIESGMPSYRCILCCSSYWPASILSRSLFLFTLPAPLALLFGPPPLVSFSSLGFLSFSVSRPLSCFWVSGWGLPHLGLGGYVTRLSCARQICAPRASCRRPWVMQPVFLEEEEGSGPRRPFDSAEPGSACFCCGPRPVPAPVMRTLEPSRGGGK